MTRRKVLRTLGITLLLVGLPACGGKSATSPPSKDRATAGGGHGREGEPTGEGGWKEFPIPGVGASVLMPVQPDGPRRNEYPSEKDGVAYVASGPGGEVNVLVFTPDAPAGQSVDEALDAYVQRQGGAPADVGAAIKRSGLPARAYVIGGDKPAWEDRLIVIGAKWVILRANDLHDPAANKTFFESFKVTAGR
jgi:hypothetical protein